MVVGLLGKLVVQKISTGFSDSRFAERAWDDRDEQTDSKPENWRSSRNFGVDVSTRLSNMEIG